MTHKILAAATGVAALVALSVPAAHASKDPVYRANGMCSAGADWKIKAKNDDGRIEVEFEVDSNRIGQRWAWALSDNGVLKRTGVKYTSGPSGSFSVERHIANMPGNDALSVTARNRAGQTCLMSLTFPG
jgi:hypothetical protein